MRILALETVEFSGSVAVLDGERVIGSAPLPAGERSAQSLAPTIQELLTQVGWKPAEVQLVAVTSGPGSFTSLRIGVTTAKAFAYGVGCQIQGVDSLDVIALRLPPEVARFSVVLDAQRQQLFVSQYARNAQGQAERVSGPMIQDNFTWLTGLSPGDYVTGPAVTKLAASIPAGVSSAPEELRAPTAVATGQLALQLYKIAPQDDVFSLLPQYFRRTAAEEQAEKRGK